jgi:hypothetical protein
MNHSVGVKKKKFEKLPEMSEGRCDIDVDFKILHRNKENRDLLNYQLRDQVYIFTGLFKLAF